MVEFSNAFIFLIASYRYEDRWAWFPLYTLLDRVETWGSMSKVQTAMSCERHAEELESARLYPAPIQVSSGLFWPPPGSGSLAHWSKFIVFMYFPICFFFYLFIFLFFFFFDGFSDFFIFFDVFTLHLSSKTLILGVLILGGFDQISVFLRQVYRVVPFVWHLQHGSTWPQYWQPSRAPDCPCCILSVFGSPDPSPGNGPLVAGHHHQQQNNGNQEQGRA